MDYDMILDRLASDLLNNLYVVTISKMPLKDLKILYAEYNRNTKKRKFPKKARGLMHYLKTYHKL